MEAQLQHNPLISVILPVYNSEKFIKEAIQSILNQTYKNFELIVLNDGSTDNSSREIHTFNDSRIIYKEHSNMGLAATLNEGLAMARGVLIARQDNDDISLPERFEKQVKFFNTHPNLVLLGTAAEIIDENGYSTGRYHRHPTDSLALKFSLVFDNPFVHSSVMFKKDAIGKLGNYSTDKSVFEDYNLWSRVAREHEVANLPESLLKYRELSSGMSKSTRNYKTLVKNQSVQNILFYCPSLGPEDAGLLADHELLLSKYPRMGTGVKVYEKLMDKFVHGFCKTENIDEKIISETKKKQYLNFKRRAYNYIIYSSANGTLAKLEAKFLRKVMFILHKKYLD